MYQHDKKSSVELVRFIFADEMRTTFIWRHGGLGTTTRCYQAKLWADLLIDKWDIHMDSIRDGNDRPISAG